ncbi:MAG: hypothetical protein R3305_01220 [Gammaproteobacteria bacterium]|nr:hypothetical protein [Gammaproteobacteria bacterium]
MKRRATFLGEAVFGFVASLVAAAVALTLGFVLPGAEVARIVVAGLGLVLVLRAIGRSNEKTGRIVTVALWLAVSAGVYWLDLGLAGYVAVHATLVWLVRSLFSYARLTDAGLDLGMTALALCFAVFAAVRTDSVFLAVWCFLLVQAAQTAIPALGARLAAGKAADVPADDPNRGFADALKAADDALQRLAARH